MFFITMLSLQIVCQAKSIVVSFANEETEVQSSYLNVLINAAILMWPFSGSALKSQLSHFEFHALPDRKSTRLNASHSGQSRMPSSA